MASLFQFLFYSGFSYTHMPCHLNVLFLVLTVCTSKVIFVNALVSRLGQYKNYNADKEYPWIKRWEMTPKEFLLITKEE